MTSVAQTLAEGTALLRDSSPSPRADALLLLGHALRRGREWIVAHGDATPSLEERDAFQRLSAQRCEGVPVAYLLGSAGFCGREFLVNESVLVPRPETEHLVDEALRFIGRRPLQVLDVGTGCGAIACTIAAETRATVCGTDISPAAVAIAHENARRFGVTDRCRFYVGDLTEPVGAQRFDLVVANLPYVPTAEIPSKPDPAAFEPLEALDGGRDGLTHYCRLLDTLALLLNADALVLLEAAPLTMPGLSAIARSALPNSAIAVCRDYAGLERFLRISAGGASKLSFRSAPLRGGTADEGLHS